MSWAYHATKLRWLPKDTWIFLAVFGEGLGHLATVNIEDVFEVASVRKSIKLAAADGRRLMNMKKALHYFSIRQFFGALLLILGFSQTTGFSATAFVKVGELAQDFTLSDHTTGKPVRLSDFAGTVIFLDMFAYW